MELRWSLPLLVDAHAERTLKALSRIDDLLGNFAADNPLRRRVPHLELTARYIRSGDNFKIRLRHEIPDLELALAHDCQCWSFDPANSDNRPPTSTKNDGRRSCQRQVVDLIGLPARNGGGIQKSIFGVRLRPAKCVPDRLRVLSGKQHPHDLAPVLEVLENFLTDELALAIAIGREPDSLCVSQRVANGFELGGLVPALRRASAVQAVGAKQDRRPALPGRHNVLGLEQVQEMALGREDVSVARTHGGANVFGLAGFLGDNDLIRHRGFVQGSVVGARKRENVIGNALELLGTFLSAVYRSVFDGSFKAVNRTSESRWTRHVQALQG